MDMRTSIEILSEEAEQQLRDHVWAPTTADRTIAAKAAADLNAVISAPSAQGALPAIDRLEHLREALAVLAIALAHVHGRLAWFLGAATTALTPVLNWRALPDQHGPTFGAVEPSPQEYTDAESAIRRLHATLTHITAT
ncbi:hypothetical protein AB0F18_20455 [Streptomyces sp. NPDC029216]|uniref:hypothetical protein n=1 Tax=Streptomyces sp. NPDC029216 TaxID=3154701 RepID=UPI0033E02016